MIAAVLVKNGLPHEAFKLQERPDPKPQANEVCVKTEGFGLNFADVMARLGNYKDCPPLPTIIGYEAVGRVESFGEGVTHVKEGQRVLAFTRFGAYASKVITQASAVVPISEEITLGAATALATQYCTAYYAAEMITNIYKGEHILIHAAAGGVGTALVQLAKRKGCIVYGTAGSPEKLGYLKKLGVDHPINYRQQDFDTVIKKIAPEGKVNAIFDSIGGSYVKRGIALLNAGGRMICYGAASMASRKKNIFKMAKTGFEFGFYHPAQFMMSSKALIGVNMLRIADHQPHILQQCLQDVVALAEQKILVPTVGKVFHIDELAEAHDYLELRKSIGKVAVKW